MALDVAVGTLNKDTASAPVSQDVVLSFVPKALILWTAGSPVAGDTFTASHRFALGFYDGTTARSCGVASQDAANNANTSKRMAAKALTIVQWAQSLQAECDASFLPGGGFRLTWTTNNASAYRIHYIAIGGADCNAKVVQWARDGSGTGLQFITGATFEPNLVMSMTVNASASLPSTTAGALMSFGIADALANQWSWTYGDEDDAGTMRADRAWTEAAILQRITTAAAGSISDTVVFQEMTSDGFVIQNTNAGNDFDVFSLCLSVPNAKVGTEAKTTTAATVSQTISGLGFTPNLAGLGSVHATTSGIAAHFRMAMGAFSAGPSEAASVVQVEDNVGTSNVDSLDSTTKAIVLADNATVTVTSQADGVSFASDQFTISWTTNSATAVRLGWWAIGDRATPNAITGLTVRAVGDCDSDLPGNRLTWDQPNPATDFVSYDVYRKRPDDPDNTDWVHIAHITVLAQTYYTDYAVASRTIYEYAVVWNDNEVPATDTSTYQDPPKVGYVRYDYAYLHAVSTSTSVPTWSRLHAEELDINPQVQAAVFDVWGRETPTVQFGEGFASLISVRLSPHPRRNPEMRTKLRALMRAQQGVGGNTLCLRSGRDRSKHYVALLQAPYSAMDRGSWESALSFVEVYFDETPEL